MLEMERQRQQRQADQAGDGPKIPLLTIRTPQSTPKRSSSLVLKVPTPSSAAVDDTPTFSSSSSSKKKKESKKQRRTRVANEIFENMLRIKDTLDMYRENCLFCQQTCFVSVDTMFLLNHFNVVHNQSEVREVLKEDPQHCIDRIKRHLKDVRVRDSIFTYDVVDEFKFSGYRKYRCCYCSGKVFEEYSDLFKHIDEEHKTHMLTCPLCNNIFLNYGSYASHVCFGPPQSQQTARAKFRCKICRKQVRKNINFSVFNTK